MSLTVHILTKNNENTIQKTLKSVSQIGAELSVIDLGSTDDTVDICCDYQASVKFTTETRRDLIRNKAVKESRTDWQMWIEPWEMLYNKQIIFEKRPLYASIIENGVISKEIRIWNKNQGIKFVNPVFERFRKMLSDELAQDVQKFLSNPSCACNHPIYVNVMKKATQQISDYFPTKELIEPEKMVEKLAVNEWQVINCHIDELAEKLRTLGPGRKQVEVARWQDQVTVIVNDLDVLF